MCGISALIRLPQGRVTKEMIRAMTGLIKHRGPDDEGFLLISNDFRTTLSLGGPSSPQNVYTASLPYAPKTTITRYQEKTPSENYSILLGHRRLAIVDLSAAGHQPMSLSDSSIWITYNGEIYNYIELRQELETRGHVFFTQSDTEVILKAYKEWGSACLNKFNGMFAFVVIDLKQQQLFAARDRYGEKPLYFWLSPNGFLAFASEIKQFTVLPGWHARINTSRAIDYLAHGLTDFSRETLFSEVFQLNGGQYIECPLKLTGIPQVKKWYSLVKNPYQLSFEEASQQFYNLFEDSIRLRLRADVDVGSCLSGGLDSSSIVCMVHRLLNDKQGLSKQKTFSACSHIPKFDERLHIQEIIKQTNVEGYFVTPSLINLLPTLKTLAWMQDEPFGSSSIYAQYLVFDLAKTKNVKVMLDGQGADESLLGYREFWMAYLSQLLKSGKWTNFQQERQLAIETHSFRDFSIKGLIKQLIPARLKNTLKQIRLENPLANFLYPWINFEDSYNRSSKHVNIRISSFVDQLSFDQLHSTNLPALLRYEDRNSMAHSIEARTPFLDYRLVEFLYNLPTEYKISQGYTKRILRQSLDFLPETIRWRTDKIGFATAEEVWMRHEQPVLFRKEVSQAIEKSRGLINGKAIHVAEKMLNGQTPFDWTLWRIINFGYWADAFM